MLSQHALLSIISVSVLYGSSYSAPKRYKEGGRQSGRWLHCQQHSEQAKNALGTCSSWLDIRRCLKSSLTPSHTRVMEPGPLCHSELTVLQKTLLHLSAPNICAHLNFYLLTLAADRKTIFRLNFNVYHL